MYVRGQFRYDGRVNNYAFIDGQNLFSGIKQLGWDLDTRKFRTYLGRKYGVTKAFYFIGYLPQQQGLYRRLGAEGYDLVFKPIVPGTGGCPPGDAEGERRRRPRPAGGDRGAQLRPGGARD